MTTPDAEPPIEAKAEIQPRYGGALYGDLPPGRDWVVDGLGNVITGPDGSPVDGRRVSEVQRRAGRPMSNREAAAQVMGAEAWVAAVKAEVLRLEAEDDQASQVDTTDASAPQPDSQLRPAVDMPNPIPTGSRFGQATESYAMGIPPSPSPSWVPDAVRHRIDRLRGDGVS